MIFASFFFFRDIFSYRFQLCTHILRTHTLEICSYHQQTSLIFLLLQRHLSRGTYVHTYITHTHMLETRSKYHCMGLVHSDPFIVMPLKDTHVRTCCHSVFEQKRARIKDRCEPYEVWEREEEEDEPPCVMTQHH